MIPYQFLELGDRIEATDEVRSIFADDKDCLWAPVSERMPGWVGKTLRDYLAFDGDDELDVEIRRRGRGRADVEPTLAAWCQNRKLGDDMTWVGKNFSLAECKSRVADLLALLPAGASQSSDAEMMLRRIVSRRRSGREIPADWWPHIERIAMRNASPLRETSTES